MKKVLSILFGLVLCFSMVACNRNFGLTEKIDKNRTQLYVFNYDAAYGSEWIYEIKERFEEEYKDYRFEPGTSKVGVQIMIEANKLSFNSDAATVKNSANEVFFTENVAYNDLVSQNALLNITDIVQDASSGTSLESRMTEDQKSSLTALKGKYYALPHYDGYRGVSYDIDLFEEKGLYFAAEKENGNNGFIILKTDKRSAGPDGKFGTDDDGLPSTMEEFFMLCDYMIGMNITPIVFTGMYSEYTNYIIESTFGSYSGADALKLDYTYDSKGEEVEIITGFEELKNDFFGAKPIIDKVVITPENGYLLRQQVGKYYGLAMLSKLLSDSRYYYGMSTNQTFSHLDAQEAFIYSKLENSPIAMIVDGSCWMQEAQGAFERSVEDFGSRAENRNFGWMPLPGVVSGEVTEENASKNAARDTVRSYAYINANIANDENKVYLAKLFLSYCYKLENLQKFTEITGSPRGLSYTITDSNKEKMDPYYLDIWEMHENYEMVRPLSTSELFINNERDILNALWESTVSNQPYSKPYTALKDSVNARDYFNGMKIKKADWEKDYSRWF